MFKILFILFYLIFGASNVPENENKIDPSEYPSKEELLGQINPESDKDFVKVNPEYSYFPEVYLRESTYNEYLKMRKDALNEGIELTVKSGTRSFYVQRFIWNKKFTGKRETANQYVDQSLSDSMKTAIVIRYNAMPGTSRHHWGTEIDFNSTSHSYFKSGEGKKVYKWLQENAEDYGFYQVYTPYSEKRPCGYKQEEWHWTYKPESDRFTKAYKDLIDYSDLKGFKGDDQAESFKVIENYVYGINPKLLN